MKGIMSSTQRKHENEVAELQATVDKLLMVGVFYFSPFFTVFLNPKIA